MTLALFDFDGTLTTRDTLWEFISFCHSRPKVWWGYVLLSPWMVLLALRIISPESGKKKVLGYFFKGQLKEDMEKAGEEFCTKRLPEIMNKKVLTDFQLQLQQHSTVCVVTASCSIWVKPFCRNYKCDLLATELDFTHGRFSGAFSTPNCNREEKPVRIRAAYDLNRFSKIIAYGNSSSDLPMFAIAHETFMV